MANLFSALSIKSITLKNRIAVSPMCQYSSVDGFGNDWHLVHLGSRAVGGAALVIQEATAVEARGRISYADMGIWKDDHIPFLKRITDFIKSQGAVPGIQLAHAGRKASVEVPWKGGRVVKEGPNHWTTIAPSAIPFYDDDPAPEELTEEGIQTVIHSFQEGARRAREAGYQLIEIHGAHGYLINEFLSPLTNRRTDRYGGSFENRIRFLLEVIQAARQEWPPELPVFVRLSATDWRDDGWTVNDSVELARRLKPLGIDLVDCSSGGNVPGVKIPVEPGYQVHLAEAVRRQAGMMSGAVGLITDPLQAEAILAAGQADLIIMAREHLRDPYFALHAAKILGEEVDWPEQYLRAKSN